MKTQIIMLLLLSGLLCNAQVIHFSDANFKNRLLQADTDNGIAYNIYNASMKIDLNNNSEIEVNEALAVYKLSLNDLNSPNAVKIANLTGIEYFTNLEGLGCLDNHLTSIDLRALTNLRSFNCQLNPLTSINLSGLTSLIYLGLELNQLKELDLTTLANLTNLDCSSNQLTTLHLGNLKKLEYLRANNNPFTSLDFTGIHAITALQCMSARLTSLDVSGLYKLDLLMCAYNPLTWLNMKNGSIETGLNLGNLPDLEYLCCDEAQVSQMQKAMSSVGESPKCVVGTYCTFSPGGVNNSLNGTGKIDYSKNGCELSGIIYPFLKLELSKENENWYIFADQSGNYSVKLDMGTYFVTPLPENPSYYTAFPSKANVDFTIPGSSITQDFCVIPNGNFPDLDIAVIPILNAIPGFNAKYRIIYRNKGNLLLSGTVNLAFNDTVEDFVNANPALVSRLPNILTWSFTDLLPLETRQIDVTFKVNAPTEIPPMNSGDTLWYTAKISPEVGDITPANNSFLLLQTVLNSMDPNDKTCLEGNFVTPELVGKSVHYLIRFENTGNYPAQNVIVVDSIDTTRFNIASLVPLSGSHPYVTRIKGNRVEFVFENINLPFDDDTNDGFIAFSIKTLPSLAIGSSFSNSADIYFDYNYPVKTNNSTTTIIALSDKELTLQGNEFTISPNPAKRLVSIHFENPQNIRGFEILVYNQYGVQVTKSNISTQNPVEFDISGFMPGIYYIQLSDSKTRLRSKIKKLIVI